jgi:hypothetical protein
VGAMHVSPGLVLGQHSLSHQFVLRMWCAEAWSFTYPGRRRRRWRCSGTRRPTPSRAANTQVWNNKSKVNSWNDSLDDNRRRHNENKLPWV